MSDFGLDAGIYEQLRAYADRLDCALVNLRSQDKNVVAKAREELVVLLRRIGKSDTLQPDRQLITMILAQELKNNVDELYHMLDSLTDSLKNSKLSKEELTNLERIASAIDKECASTGKRMRGRL